MQFRHPIPPVLQAPPQTSDVDFLEALLWMGIVGVSPNMLGWWPAIRWAELRYLNAANHETDALRLHPSLVELDTHHLRALSDDWGVGIAIQWLTRQFQFADVGHGRFYLNDLVEVQKVAEFQRKPGRRGPSKCPDLVAYDSAGLIYLIECKGTTTNREHTSIQFAQARQQKVSVVFADETRVAQRLATGLFISKWNSDEVSTLRISDPPPRFEEPKAGKLCFVKKVPHKTLLAPIKKETIFQGFLAAGLAEYIADLLPTIPGLEDYGVRQIAETRPAVQTFGPGREWRGRISRFALSLPVRVGDRQYSACTMREGVSRQLLGRLGSHPTRTKLESVFEESDTSLRTQQRKVGDFDAYSAEIRHGESFLTEITLM